MKRIFSLFLFLFLLVGCGEKIKPEFTKEYIESQVTNIEILNLVEKTIMDKDGVEIGTISVDFKPSNNTSTDILKDIYSIIVLLKSKNLVIENRSLVFKAKDNSLNSMGKEIEIVYAEGSIESDTVLKADFSKNMNAIQFRTMLNYYTINYYTCSE